MAVGRGLLAGLLALAVLAHRARGADDESAGSAPEARLPRLSGELAVDVPSRYYDRGILNEGTGLVVQPWADLALTVLEGRGPLTRLDLTTTLWGTFHSGPTGADSPDASDPKAWYEADVYLGASATVAERWEATVSYAWASSPNGSFDRIDELWTTLAFDDEPEEARRFLGRRFLGWQPSVLFTAELRGQNDEGTRRGQHLGLAIEPTLALAEGGERPIDLAFPVRLGLGLSGFYEDEDGHADRFGCASAGAWLTCTLLPRGEGGLVLVAGIDVLFLGRATSSYAEGRDVDVVGTIGLHFVF